MPRSNRFRQALLVGALVVALLFTACQRRERFASSTTPGAGQPASTTPASALPTVATSAAEQPPSTTTPAGGQRTLVHDGLTRSYVVRTPGAGGPTALVVMLHGGGGNADSAEMMTGLTDKGRAEGFTVVYPNGTGGTGDSLLTWNAGHCCGSAIRNAVDDVGFIGAMLDDVLATFNIDPNRVFVTGMSNGAMMAHRVAYALSDRIAAIAPVVGAVFGDEATPATPVSMLAINGALDENVPPAGGTTGGRPFAWDGTPMLPSVQQGVWWATANGCEVTATAADHGAYVERQHLCPSGVSASTVIVKDNGHAWPGGKPGSRLGDTPSTTYNATDVIWAFFAAHPKHHP